MGSVLGKLLFCLGMLVAQLTSSPPCSADLSEELAIAYANRQYDTHFEYSTARFLSPWYQGDWKWLKAQGIQESLLNPDARSHAGALGLMQFMPRTWDEVSGKLGLNASPRNPRASIIAGGFYQRQMLRVWTSKRSIENHRRWAWSAYNYGVGNILKAQEKAGGTLDWWSLRPYLPQETILYIYKIEKHRRVLE